MKKRALLQAFVVASMLFGGSARATDLYAHDAWSALASDRLAHKIGDVIMIVVDANATAINAADSNISRNSNLQGQVSAGPLFGGSGNLNLTDGANDRGTTARSGSMVAEISATVDQVLPNGDLHVAGTQVLNINGERTNIRVRGRVRLADISAMNSVLSSRLADATIDYDGSGFVSSSAQPGVIGRVFNWLGIP